MSRKEDHWAREIGDRGLVWRVSHGPRCLPFGPPRSEFPSPANVSRSGRLEVQRGESTIEPSAGPLTRSCQQSDCAASACPAVELRQHGPVGELVRTSGRPLRVTITSESESAPTEQPPRLDDFERPVRSAWPSLVIFVPLCPSGASSPCVRRESSSSAALLPLNVPPLGGETDPLHSVRGVPGQRLEIAECSLSPQQLQRRGFSHVPSRAARHERAFPCCRRATVLPASSRPTAGHPPPQPTTADTTTSSLAASVTRPGHAVFASE